ncbi:CRISPR-associated endonuclease Cas2 [Candidatus Gottesmanbacteria bacterium]|nr:CRISPR-associated endonuclease Cas2 [Candidatus Gottesmanbacteria bacterium]
MGRKRLIPEKDLREKIIPVTSEILKIVGAAALIGAVMTVPATAVLVTPILKFVNKKIDEREEIKSTKFDKIRLWLILRRLEKQRDVELEQKLDGMTIVKLTEKGKTRFLQYKLEEMPELFNKKNWDRKWRIIVFDVPEKERGKRDSFRAFLNRLKFFQLQESVYLTPYPCETEIEYLREYYGLGKKVQVLVTMGLEDDSAYRAYFGLV